jgi:uncharacterized protein (TIGR02145 family)
MKLRSWLVQGRGLLLAAVVALAVGLSGCGNNSGGGNSGGSSGRQSDFTDSRDGQKYRAVKIGNQKWLAQNLNYKTGNSWCHGDDDSKCQQYGRLYDWKTAKSACPSGWHLPSREEWNELVTATGGDVAGRALKSVSGGWKDGANGIDGYGFSALPGGYRGSDGSFDDAGDFGGWCGWWTAAEVYASLAYIRYMGDIYDYVGEDAGYEEYGVSVRCVGD